MGEKNKVTDVKNQLTGKKLGIEKFHPKRNRMSHYIALLLYSPQNAPNFSKQGGKYCTWKLPFGLSDRIPKNRKKKPHSKNSHVKLCARFCIKSRLVRSHEYLPGLWSQGVVCAFSTAVWAFSISEPQPVKRILWNTSLLNPLLCFSPWLSVELSSSSCLGQPFQAGTKRRAAPLPWESGAANLQEKPREG